MTPRRKVERMGRRSPLSFPAGTYTRVHTHRGDGACTCWTLMHVMNMSGVNSDWRFNAAAGFMEHYVYRKELLTIKNIPFALRGAGLGGGGSERT